MEVNSLIGLLTIVFVWNHGTRSSLLIDVAVFTVISGDECYGSFYGISIKKF